MCEKSRNMVIFPNLVINDIMAVTIRVFQPTGPDSMDVTAWQMVPAGETGSRLNRRLDSFLTFLGPGGFATPDDTEALESCQQGFRSGGVEWSDLSRGFHRDPRGQRRAPDTFFLAPLAVAGRRPSPTLNSTSAA